MTEHDSDPVGYRRPPVNSRFQPGRSGNPSGRPKTRPSFRAALLSELAAAMPAKNQQQTGSKLQAFVRALVSAAIAGEGRSQALLVGTLLRLGESEENEAASLAPEDQSILDAYVGGELKRRAGKSDAPPDQGEDDAH
jgi:hypothetical protein